VTNRTHVPLVDLALQHERVELEVRSGFDRVLKNTSFVLGPEVAEFERSFAEYCEVAEVVGVANGTDALEIALEVVGIGRGDEVVVPANTFVATAEAVARSGATLVLADCDQHFLIDVDEVAARCSDRTKAVVAVHLYGQTAAVDDLRAVVGDGVVVLEDAAQAQGATRHGVRAGGLGDVAATSFYPGKNLGAYGDAGALMTRSGTIANAARRLRNHGGAVKYEHVDVGRNSRLDALQAVVLSAKLRVLDAWNQERRAAAALYEDLLADEPRVVLPSTLPGNQHVFHLYVVRVPERDRVLAAMNADGIGAGVHYPHPVHLVPAFARAGQGRGSFPVAEQAAEEILSLPIYPGITPDQQEAVVASLVGALT
jgi:dTDP-4-amino-4,6-dideoxygalactose transaminase